MIVPHFTNDFWSHVFDCATVSERPVTGIDLFFAKSKVDKFNVAIGVEHDVLRLQIAKNNAKPVKVAEGERDLRQIHFRFRLFQNPLPLEHHKQLAALNVLQDQI